MDVHLNLPAQYQQALLQFALRNGSDVDTFVSSLVTESLQVDLEQNQPLRRRAGAFAERLRAWAARHPVLDHELDVSRESIYEGCDE